MKTSYQIIISLFFSFCSIHMALAQLAGGPGDGYASEHFLGLLSGTALESLYKGGDGDGFAQDQVNSNLQGLSSSGRFVGGPGDGHASGGFLGLLGGTSTAMLFQAGTGDGFDQDRGTGAIRTVVIFPVELLSFTATPQNAQVRLEWLTESELNNDFFTVERSMDGTAFEPLARIDGAGTTQQQQQYETIDEQPFPGLSYYRLKSTDFDGTFYYSEIVAVTFETPQKWDMQVFSNPNGGKRLKLMLSIPQEEQLIKIELIDMLGRTLWEKRIANTNGTLQHEINMSKRLVDGSYLLRASSDGGGVSKLVVIQ